MNTEIIKQSEYDTSVRKGDKWLSALDRQVK